METAVIHQHRSHAKFKPNLPFVHLRVKIHIKNPQYGEQQWAMSDFGIKFPCIFPQSWKKGNLCNCVLLCDYVTLQETL